MYSVILMTALVGHADVNYGFDSMIGLLAIEEKPRKILPRWKPAVVPQRGRVIPAAPRKPPLIRPQIKRVPRRR